MCYSSYPKMTYLMSVQWRIIFQRTSDREQGTQTVFIIVYKNNSASAESMAAAFFDNGKVEQTGNLEISFT